MQSQAAILKREIEAKLANRIPAALSPIARQAQRLHTIGNARSTPCSAAACRLARSAN